MNSCLKIDIVSDVSCPWCIIGYKSLDKALKKLSPQMTACIAWKPFELNPNMPVEGQHLGDHLHEKYGSSKADVEKTSSMITARGVAVGFEFNFNDDGRIYNTFNAHRLLLWSGKFDKQTELKLALFKLYFTEGGNPGNSEELVKVVAKAGLPTDEAARILASDQYVKEVREEQAKYRDMGISSVPTFIINDRYMISGGQPIDIFVGSLQQIIAEEAILNK